MHLNNGGINRPSLLSGGEQAKAQAPNSGRILADMEGRQTAAPSRAANTQPNNRRYLYWALFIGVLVVATAAAAWTFLGNAGSDNPEEYSLTPEHDGPTGPSGHPVAPASGANDGAAMIVDAPENAAPAAAADGSGAPAAENSAAAGSSNASGEAQASSRTASTARQRPAARAAGTGAKSKSDENLLGTLLGIIKEEDKPSAKAKQPGTMDDLIAQIEADQRQRDEDERTAFENVASKKPTSTESGIQSQLRRCPGANTLQGLECRRKICASVAGKDPACPTM